MSNEVALQLRRWRRWRIATILGSTALCAIAVISFFFVIYADSDSIRSRIDDYAVRMNSDAGGPSVEEEKQFWEEMDKISEDDVSALRKRLTMEDWRAGDPRLHMSVAVCVSYLATRGRHDDVLDMLNSTNESVVVSVINIVETMYEKRNLDTEVAKLRERYRSAHGDRLWPRALLGPG